MAACGRGDGGQHGTGVKGGDAPGGKDGDIDQTAQAVVAGGSHSGKEIPPPGFFYRRELPEPAIAFGSQLGRRLFRAAMAEGYLEGSYFGLSEQFHTQSEPSFCAIGTLVMVLNSLHIDPNRTWKGVWRWFSDEMLDCCQPLDYVIANGVTFDEFCCLSICNGVALEAVRGDSRNFTLENFREEVKRVCREDDGSFMVISYDRGGVNQTVSGTGHFSPIGAYHSETDQVLIMDVARFKYPPHWLPVEMIFDAMKAHDSVTDRPRGYATLRSTGVIPISNLSTSPLKWRTFLTAFSARLQALTTDATLEDALAEIACSLPCDMASILRWRKPAAKAGTDEDDSGADSEDAEAELFNPSRITRAIKSTPVFAAVRNLAHLNDALPHCVGPDEAALENVYVTFSLFVLALPLDVFPEALRPIVDEWRRESVESSSEALEAELDFLSTRMAKMSLYGADRISDGSQQAYSTCTDCGSRR